MEPAIWMDTPSSQAGAYLLYSLIYFCCGANPPFLLADVGGSFPGNEADRTTPFGAEYKNAWSYAATSRYAITRYAIMACTRKSMVLTTMCLGLLFILTLNELSLLPTHRIPRCYVILKKERLFP